MILLIDIGNRRLKWATSDQVDTAEARADFGRRHERQVVACDAHALESGLAAHFQALETPQRILVSSVAGRPLDDGLRALCGRLWDVVPEFLRATRHAAGMTNPYPEPERLGVDRWAAVAGARLLEPSGALAVLDAGTAVTLDFVDSRNHYPGGIIFPGIATMIESLNTATGHIRVAGAPPADAGPCIANRDTPSAVTSGALLCVVSAVDRAITLFAGRDGSPPRVVAAGGDARAIQARSEHPITCEPALVFLGLLVICGELTPGAAA